MADDTKTGSDGNKASGAQSKDQANGASADVQAAANAGISEGDVKALRDEAGVNFSAGHMANIHAWEQSEAGKKFLDDEGDRQKAIKDEAKTIDAQTNKDGLDEASAKYVEAISK